MKIKYLLLTLVMGGLLGLAMGCQKEAAPTSETTTPPARTNAAPATPDTNAPAATNAPPAAK
jgi:hypothetical protein